MDSCAKSKLVQIFTLVIYFSIQSFIAKASTDDFDDFCYLSKNPDVARSWRGKPIDHWEKYGEFELNADGTPARNPGCNPDPSTIFNGKCYLENYHDVYSSGEAQYGKYPYRHYILHGQFENRKPGCSNAPPASGNEVYSFQGNYPDHLQIQSQANAKGKIILLKAGAKKFAGAIDSIIYDNLEYIDATDHGRELQSASAFDDSGECFNPTEAGSGDDYQKNSSTSVLISAEMTSQKMITYSQTAFWLYGAEKSGACSKGANITNQPLSPQHLRKTVTMNYHGDPAVIEYVVEFFNPKGMFKSNGSYEVITGYLTGSLKNLWTLDPSNGAVVFQNSYKNLPTSLGFPNNTYLSTRSDLFLPIVVSTDDKKHAMGVFMPRLNQPMVGRPNSSFNGDQFFQFKNLNKWSLSYWDGNLDQTHLIFRVLLVVGDHDLVVDKLTSLAKKEGYWSRNP